MSLERTYHEQGPLRDALAPGSQTAEEAVTSPVTTSEVYHAALANNKTLDNLLASFDGERSLSPLQASTMLGSDAQKTGIQHSIDLHTRSGIRQTSAELRPAGAQLSLQLNKNALDFFDANDDSREHPLHHGLHDMLNSTPSLMMRHRSPIPSISSTTPLDSVKSPGTSASSDDLTAPATAVRCTACDKDCPGSDASHRCKGKSRAIDPKTPRHVISPSTRRGIPRRVGRDIHRSHLVRQPVKDKN